MNRLLYAQYAVLVFTGWAARWSQMPAFVWDSEYNFNH